MDIPDLFLLPESLPAETSPPNVELLAESGQEYRSVSIPSPAAPSPFYAETCAGVRLYQGDALELLRHARAEMFDMIFADPPYFLSNNGVTCQSGKMVSVNKGKWDKSEGLEADYQFNLDWLRECQRLLKPNGTLWVSGTSHNIYSVGYAVQSLGYKILNDIAWYKVNPPPNLACRYFTHATETILWAAKNAKSKHAFNYTLMKQMNGNKQMQSLWHIKPPATKEKRFGKHPTQKPETLLERIVLAASNEGDLVLDPFCGSGTTGVACVRHSRRFVGFDVESEYLQLAQQRLKEEIQTAHNQHSLDIYVDKSAGGGTKWRTLPSTLAMELLPLRTRSTSS